MRICVRKLPSSESSVNSAPVLMKEWCPEEKQSQSATCCCFLTGELCWIPISPHLPWALKFPWTHSQLSDTRFIARVFGSQHSLNLFPVLTRNWLMFCTEPPSNFSSNLNHREFLPALNIPKQRAAKYRENLLGKYHYLILLFLYSSLGICYW